MRSRDETGATAVLIAASMLVLIGFAAIAVDSGLVLDERRQDQNAADAAALSAGLGARVAPTQAGCQASGSLEQAAACNGAVVAMDTVFKNLDVVLTEADFADNARCGNAAFPSEYHVGGSNTGVVPRTSSNTIYCIRFTENLDKVRVVLPLINVDTTFGRVLGRDQIPVSAFAEASVTLGGPGSVLPFAVGPTGAAQSHECVFEPGAGLETSPCAGPDNGNFGYLNSYLYGDSVLGTEPPACGGAGGLGDADRIASSIAKGSDHSFLTDPLVPGTANDRDECPNKNQPIDEVNVRSGLPSGAIDPGLVGSILGTEGRLLCKDGSDPDEPLWLDPRLVSEDGGSDCEEVGAVPGVLPEELDDTDLWGFLNSSVTELSPSDACDQSAIDGSDDPIPLMTACLDAWKAWPGTHTESLFTSDIQTSPRFGWVPRLDTDPSSGSSIDYLIEDFIPVYLDTLYFNCTSTDCEVVLMTSLDGAGPCADLSTSCGWTPDDPYDPPGSSPSPMRIDAMTAYVIPRSALPSPLSNFPFDQDQVSYNLSE